MYGRTSAVIADSCALTSDTDPRHSSPPPRKIRCDGQARPCATCARLGKVCDYEPITE